MHYKIFVFLLCMTLTIFVTYGNSQEILTFKNETHLVCVSDNTTAPIYIEPVRKRDIRKINALLEFEASWEEWNLQNASTTIHAPITDVRWQDFEVKYASELNYSLEASFSFWVYQPDSINILVSYQNGGSHQTLRETEGKWTSFTIYTNNGSTKFLQNNEEYQATNLIPVKLTIQTIQQNYWTIENYKVRVAHQVSSIPTNITVPSSEKSCLVLYVYLCNYCFLEISTEAVVTLNGTINALNDVYIPQKLYLKNVAHVSLRRYTTNKVSEGYWAIDIRRCASIKLNRVTYETSDITNESVRCKGLGMVYSESNINDIFHCNQTGTFGKQCSIHCKEIFGNDRQLCEGYNICSDDSVCHQLPRDQDINPKLPTGFLESSTDFIMGVLVIIVILIILIILIIVIIKIDKLRWVDHLNLNHLTNLTISFEDQLLQNRGY